MNNVLTIAELKRRGMAAIEEGLRHGPVHIMKRNKPAAIVLSEADYERIVQGNTISVVVGMTAVQWLLSVPSSGKRTKANIDAGIKAERDW